MIPKFPINTTFDPAQSDYAADLWALPAGRILMLLWRPTHLCGPTWFSAALPIAMRIEAQRPDTAQWLFNCFQESIFQDEEEFTHEDCLEFCETAIDFFTGKQNIPYVGVVSGNASMTG